MTAASSRYWILLGVMLLLVLAQTGCTGRRGGVAVTGSPGLLEERGVADPVLQEASRRIEQGDGRRAFRLLVQRFRERPGADNEDLALWLAANALIEDGQRLRAFYYLEQLLDEHTDSPLYVPAAYKQYEIADSYLSGRADRIFYLFPQHRGDEAVEMLFRVQQRLPGSPLAEQALRRTADYYYNRGDYDFAADVYGVFIDRFPRSPDIPTIRLKQAYSNLLQYQGPRYDPTPLLDGGTQLRQFAAEFPQLAEQQNIDRILEWIEEQLAEKLMLQSAYYGRVREARARDLLLAQVIEQYPQTPQASRARERLGGRQPRLPPASEVVPAADGDVEVEP